MTYTFKLARRLARLRIRALLATTVFGAACSQADSPTAPESTRPPTLVVSPDSTAVPVNGKIQFSASSEPVVSVTLTPESASLGTSGKLRFSASAVTAGGSTLEPLLSWKATGGSIGKYGMYRAGRVAGTYLVIGTAASGVADTALVTITTTSPAVAQVELTPDSTTLRPGGNQLFIALGKTAEGATVAPSIKWVATGGTISSEGRYYAGRMPGAFHVIAMDTTSGASDTSTVTIAGETPSSPTLQAVVLTPSNVSIYTGTTQQFVASGRMSDGSSLPITITWASTGGVISSAGLYTAGQNAGTYRVIATATDGKADTATVTIVAAAPTPPPPTAGCDTTMKANLQFLGQFDGPAPFRRWALKPDALKYPYMATPSTAHVRECGSSVRMELRRGDEPNGTAYRTEINLNSDSTNGGVPVPAGRSVAGALGSEVWMGWSIYVPSDFVFETDGDTQETVTQIKSNDCAHGRSPPWELQIERDHFRVYTRYGAPGSLVQYIPPTKPLIRKGAWHDFVLHIKWSNTGTGILEMWMNGNKFVDRRNVDTIWKDCTAIVRAKMGIYKWSWDGTQSGGPSDVTTRVLYFDAVRITDGVHGSYDMVAPK